MASYPTLPEINDLPAIESLLVLLNLARPPAGTAELARKIMVGLDWPEFVRVAELNAVVPLVLAQVEALGLEGEMPVSILSRLREIAKPVAERNRLRTEWAGKLLRAMTAARIEVIVLKGSLFADTIYGNRAYKKMNDLDVLIRREDAERATEVLRSIGFQGVGALFGKEEIQSSSHHTPPYVSEDLGCVVGLHWGLVSPLSQWKVDLDGVWDRRVPTEVAGERCYRMSWEDNLAHLCIHLPFFKIGLRELADVYNLALYARPSMDWEAFAVRVSMWRAEDAVYRVLGLANALVDLGIPSPLSNRLWRMWRDAASVVTVADTVKRMMAPETILYSRSTQAAKIEKAYAVFMLSEKYSERVLAYGGMWKFLLWPKDEEMRKIAGTKTSAKGLRKALERLKTPPKIWYALGRDHGQLPLAAMTALNAGELLKATLRRPFSGEGKSLKEHPAARLLEVLE